MYIVRFDDHDSRLWLRNIVALRYDKQTFKTIAISCLGVECFAACKFQTCNMFIVTGKVNNLAFNTKYP